MRSLNNPGAGHFVYWAGETLYDVGNKQVYRWIDQCFPEYVWIFNEVMYSPDYTFREGIEPTAYQVWPTEQSEIIHEACAKDIWEREFPLYPDDIEMARNLEPIICDRCEQEIGEGRG